MRVRKSEQGNDMDNDRDEDKRTMTGARIMTGTRTRAGAIHKDTYKCKL